MVQIVDPETGEPVPDGELGSLCITELYKTGSPQFRYNIMDLSHLYPPGPCACGSWLRRWRPFAGRGDNMVKLRGVNVWPEAVGDIASAVAGVAHRLLRPGRARGQPRRADPLGGERGRPCRSSLPSPRRSRSVCSDRLGVRIRWRWSPRGPRRLDRAWARPRS